MVAFTDKKPSLDLLGIRQALSLTPEQFSNLLRVTVQTLGDWEKGKSYPTDPDQLQRLSKLQEITYLASMVYTPQGLQEFFSTSLPIFGEKSGFDLIQMGEFDSVIAALASDFEGTGF